MRSTSTKPQSPQQDRQGFRQTSQRNRLRESRGWRTLATGAAALRQRLPAWALRPEFLVILGLGALLRLLFPGQSSFLSDQAELLALARSALLHSALPVTGIRSSIGTLNPPASIYLLLPFAISSNPIWAVLATALANIIAVVALYALVNRYVGRRAAFFAGLLYAAAPWPVYFSRFIWQQNFLAPIVVLFFWTLCRGVIDRRRGWLAWNVALWAVAIQLHPTAAALLALTALGVALRWRDLRWRDGVLTAAVLIVFFIPTILWELVSHGSDAGLYSAYIAQGGAFDNDAINLLLSVIGPLNPNVFGFHTPYSASFPVIFWLGTVLPLIYVASWLWLVAALAYAGWRQRDQWRRWQFWPWSAAPVQAAQTIQTVPEKYWLFLLLLGLWQALPLLTMLKHSTAIHEHYLLVLLPAVFIQIGVFLDWLADALGLAILAASRWLTDDDMRGRLSLSALRNTAAWRTLRRYPRSLLAENTAARLRLSARWAVVVLVGVVVVTQTFGIGVELFTIQSNQFDGVNDYSYSHYGIPLSTQEAALNATTTAARAHGADAYIASNSLHQEPLGYLATAEGGAANVYDASQCLIVPSAGATPAVVLATPEQTVTPLLSQMTGVSLLRNIPSRGSQPMPLYLVAPGAHLADETSFQPQTTINGAQLVGYEFETTSDGISQLALHWSGMLPPARKRNTPAYWYGNSPKEQAPRVATYTFYAQQVNSAGVPSGTPFATVCSALAWGSDEDVYAVIPLPLALTTQANHWNISGWHVWAFQQSIDVSQPGLGPLRLETGNTNLGPYIRLPGSATFPFP